ncbi:hypothetical protein SPRG_05990 [Saprolegnia parasitica CBS 223.65]|uniref:START domain-containing protein n=1 Tax=Saprolegnia parasitica (strain CBS 223.65) TaxID=695850 RepID=A0A067CRL6_SAPPC|nr:hypothetical protein SPRG_05990 [Saprolegnia parasitica CBS 223.65]KDO29452.1 hypothetical protein SPRG_05990 [Saprolegnia parasitica CBS 223.65]|eukprot:XP_012199951.1 hypothetical protein SPRG_05990 [Saprolegnia parasitica CBS 223.65]
MVESILAYDATAWSLDADEILGFLHAPGTACTASPTEDPPVSAQKRYRKRQQAEVQRLHDEANQLSAHLTVLQNIRRMETSQSSFWEKKARLQRLSVRKAAHENAKLKEAIETQQKVLETIQQLLHKPLKLTGTANVELMDVNRRFLPQDSGARHACCHAMTDEMYERADTFLLRRGLYDGGHGHNSICIDSAKHQDTISIEMQWVKDSSVGFREAADRFWSLWYQPEGNAINIKNLATFGRDTVYVQFIDAIDGLAPYAQRLACIKRFEEPDRIVFVMQSVLQDATYPVPSGLYTANDTFVFVAERVTDTTCRRRFCLAGELPLAPPPGNPLAGLSKPAICDRLLDEAKRVCVVFDHILGDAPL